LASHVEDKMNDSVEFRQAIAKVRTTSTIYLIATRIGAWVETLDSTKPLWDLEDDEDDSENEDIVVDEVDDIKDDVEEDVL